MNRGLRVAALGAGAGLLGGAFAVPALIVPGVALVLLAASAQASVRLATWLARIELEPAAATVEEGAQLHLSVRVGGWWLPFGGGELSILPGAPFQPVRRLLRGRAELAVRAQRRGPSAIGPAAVRYRDPLGLCTRVRLSDPGEMLVLPRVEAVPRARLARAAGIVQPLPLFADRAEGAEVDGLRPYRPGAPATRIHWATVARTGTLVERLVHEQSQGLPLIVFDARWPASAEALDMAVRAAASLCVGLAQLGGCSLLLPGSHSPQPVQGDLAAWPALHRALALLEPGGEAPWRGAEAAEVVLWVSARRPESPPARRGMLCTVSPIPLDRRAVLFAVAGCAVQLATGRRGLVASAA